MSTSNGYCDPSHTRVFKKGQSTLHSICIHAHNKNLLKQIRYVKAFSIFYTKANEDKKIAISGNN